jgi:hypothetical protein
MFVLIICMILFHLNFFHIFWKKFSLQIVEPMTFHTHHAHTDARGRKLSAVFTATKGHSPHTHTHTHAHLRKSILPPAWIKVCVVSSALKIFISSFHLLRIRKFKSIQQQNFHYKAKILCTKLLLVIRYMENLPLTMYTARIGSVLSSTKSNPNIANLRLEMDDWENIFVFSSSTLESKIWPLH